MSITIYARALNKTTGLTFEYSGSSFDGATMYEMEYLNWANIASTKQLVNIEFVGGSLVDVSGTDGTFSLVSAPKLKYYDMSGLKNSSTENFISSTSNVPSIQKVKLGSQLYFGYRALFEPTSTGVGYWGTSGNKLEVIGSTPAENLGNTTSGLFEGCNCSEIDISNLNVIGDITSLCRLFAYCRYVISIDLSNWDLTKLTGSTSLQNVFRNCFNLQYLKK